MEMNADLIAIQGLLSSVVKITGALTKIEFKGGNEMKINQVIGELEDYLTSKHYIEKRKTNKLYHKELSDITLFLAINLEFNNKAVEDIKEFAHLINVIPKFSKCLLANVIVELDLSEYYCCVLHRLPAELAEELLCEIVPCIKKSSAETTLELTYLFMKNIINKLDSMDTSNYKMTEYIEKLEDISSEILLNCSGINSDYIQGWKEEHIYRHMGLTLLCLLKLLLQCHVDNEALFKIIDDLINTICTIMKAVTISVFITWAEVEHEHEPLQTVIAEEAYHVIANFQKYQPASPLIQMIGFIAKKPKSLNEMIHKANTSTMIMKIEQNPVDRKKWFTALLNSQVFQNKESKECLNRWAHLCTIDDLGRLLSLSVHHKNEDDVTDLLIKCASFFAEEELAIIMCRFFHQHGLKNCLKSKNSTQQLTITLNKLQKQANNDPVKDVLLLFLQEPEQVLSALYRECIKTDILLESLKETFTCLGEIIGIEKLFLNVLEKLMVENKIDSNNTNNYEKLFKVIALTNYKKLLHNFIIPHVEVGLTKAEYDEVNYIFNLYRQLVDRTSSEEVDTLIQISIKVLEKCRWKIFDFTNAKTSLCQQAVQFLTECRDLPYSDVSEETTASLQHVVNEYYVLQLRDRTELDFLQFTCPNLDTVNHGEFVGCLIKLLPLCVQTEWITIANALMRMCESQRNVEIITDTLIVITQVAKTQSKSDNSCIKTGLQYCVQNYGLILKDIVLPLKNEETNAVLVKNVCHLLRELPTELLDIEGMSLVSLIPDKTLKGLTRDESFISILLSMKGSQLSRIIAKRMLP